MTDLVAEGNQKKKSQLRGKPPAAIEKRLKLFLFGDYGTGKTTAALSFPQSYIFDCEKGAENDSYVELMNKGKSSILQTNDTDEITSELRSLISEDHSYKTIVLDPVTTLEADLIEKAQKKYTGDGDMRIWRDRDQALRRISNLLLKADMNVVVTAHGKIDYGPNMTKLGTTFDGWKRWPYLFDIVIELKRVGKDRVGFIRKTRVSNFVDGEDFKWSYEEFRRRYGNVIERDAKSLRLATKGQIVEINYLIDILKLPEDTVEKWKSKAAADSWDEFPEETIQKCIDFCHKLIKGNNKEAK